MMTPLSHMRELLAILGRHVLAGALVMVVLGSALWGCSLIEDTQRRFLPPPTVFKDEAEKARALYDQVWVAIKYDYVDGATNQQKWGGWRHRYDKYLKNRDDARVAIETMLASLNDPYTRLMAPEDVKEQSLRMDGRLFGVGVQINYKDGDVVIVAPLDDSPAKRAGLMPMDRIVSVDGQSLENKTLEEVASLIRGPKGTPVQLGIVRHGVPKTVKLIRDEITLKVVFSESISPEIGYIRLSTFISQDASREMADALIAFKNKKGLVLDLRSNNGGLLTNAIDISNMFLKSGKIVSVIGRNGEREVYTAEKDFLFDKPLVVLIDQGSASASEILAGALQDNDRSVLVGQTSFGKGMVQKIYPLLDGSDLYMTISKYYTPDGTDINEKGISPDVAVELTIDDVAARRDVQKDRALAMVKALVEQHLLHPSARKAVVGATT
ncbi:MAG: PDZ domain-containing protein [Cyanobacteria bacterium HKST-UBA03]|nr:PDZ domain-containing protein [Cyanobacteria bacterium HKST-UBA03]